MTIDVKIWEKIDEEKIYERAKRLLQTLDRVNPIIFEIRALESEDGVHPIEMSYLQGARYVLQAAHAIVETNFTIDIGAESFLERYYPHDNC
jgi:hypothetical protein